MAMTSEQAKRVGKLGGRPKGTLSEATKIGIELRKRLAKEVKKQFPHIKEKMLKLAFGGIITSIDYDRDGNVIKEYYAQPSESMLRYLLDQIAGKAAEKLEIDDKSSKEINEMSTRLKEIIENARLANKQNTGK